MHGPFTPETAAPIPAHDFLWYIASPHRKTWTFPVPGGSVEIDLNPYEPQKGEFGVHLTGTFTADPPPAPPPAPPAPTCTKLPLLTGGSTPGDTLWTTAGGWDETVTTTIEWLADGQPISGQTSGALLTTSAQAGKGIQSRVSAKNAAGEITRALSSNVVQMTVAPSPTPTPVPTPTPTPVPSGAQPHLPASWLGSKGLSIKSYLGDFHDVSSEYWDCGVGGVMVHGSANGVCDSQRQNAFMRPDGVAVLRTNRDHAIWATMIPAGMPGNGAGGGARKGLVLPDKCIVQARIAFTSGVNFDGPGGPDANHAYPWNGPYTQSRESAAGSVNYAEIDWLEIARWPGAAGQPTMSYHVTTGPNSYDSNPGAISPSPPVPIADGKFHDITLVKGGVRSATSYNVWDGVPWAQWVMRDSYQHCVMFSGGYSADHVPPVFPCDMLLERLDVWELA